MHHWSPDTYDISSTLLHRTDMWAAETYHTPAVQLVAGMYNDQEGQDGQGIYIRPVDTYARPSVHLHRDQNHWSPDTHPSVNLRRRKRFFHRRVFGGSHAFLSNPKPTKRKSTKRKFLRRPKGLFGANHLRPMGTPGNFL